MQLPKPNDLGYIKNYLSDNLDAILACISQCYCGVLSEEYYQSFYNKLIFHFSSKIKEVLA